MNLEAATELVYRDTLIRLEAAKAKWEELKAKYRAMDDEKSEVQAKYLMLAMVAEGLKAQLPKSDSETEEYEASEEENPAPAPPNTQE